MGGVAAVWPLTMRVIIGVIVVVGGIDLLFLLDLIRPGDVGAAALIFLLLLLMIGIGVCEI